MAQLVARFHGMEEVRGSNPLSSTISATILRISVIVVLFFYCRNVRVNTRVNSGLEYLDNHAVDVDHA